MFRPQIQVYCLVLNCVTIRLYQIDMATVRFPDNLHEIRVR